MAQIDKKKVAKAIKKIRVIDLDMSQREFAKKLGTTQSMVSKYEKGLTLPTTEILYKIAKLGKITVEKILEGKSAGEI